MCEPHIFESSTVLKPFLDMTFEEQNRCNIWPKKTNSQNAWDWYIYHVQYLQYICWIFLMANVGIYSCLMDPMGNKEPTKTKSGFGFGKAWLKKNQLGRVISSRNPPFTLSDAWSGRQGHGGCFTGIPCDGFYMLVTMKWHWHRLFGMHTPSKINIEPDNSGLESGRLEDDFLYPGGPYAQVPC